MERQGRLRGGVRGLRRTVDAHRCVRKIYLGKAGFVSPVIEGVFFDFGGTLARYPREEIFKEILRDQEIPVSSAKLRRALCKADAYWAEKYGGSEREWSEEIALDVNRVVLRAIGIEDTEELAVLVFSDWETVSKRFDYEIFPDVEPCLVSLERMDKKLGVISNCPSADFLEQHLRHIGIRDFFQCLVASGSEGVSKPDPKIFHIASARIGLTRSSLLYVGDTLGADVQGAVKAGLRAVLLDREGTAQYDGAKISDLKQMQGFLKGL